FYHKPPQTTVVIYFFSAKKFHLSILLTSGLQWRVESEHFRETPLSNSIYQTIFVIKYIFRSLMRRHFQFPTQKTFISTKAGF
ncbi:hypothetical protein D3Z62_30450, partial [Lachnospiraceae bacterium]|nr:hypothetical protein [Lachnospiraceae bacterium]